MEKRNGNIAQQCRNEQACKSLRRKQGQPGPQAMEMYWAAPELDPNTDQRGIADSATSTVALAGLSQAEGVTRKTAARLTSVGLDQTQPAACQRSPTELFLFSAWPKRTPRWN